MSYNKKIIIAIFFLVTLVMVFVFYKLFAVKFEYLPYHFDNIKCLIPSHFEPFPYQKNQWKGKRAFNHSKTQWIYIVKKNHLYSTTLENYLNNIKRIKSFKLNNNLIFGVQALGKSYRRYIYLFCYQNQAYWIESGARNSTLLLIKENADKILTSLKINDKNPLPDLEPTIKKTTSMISPLYSQSLEFFLFILIGIFLLTYLIIIVIFYYANKEPKEFIEQPLQFFKGITFKISFIPFGMQMYDGIVASTRKKLHLYTFKKLITSIKLDNINDIGRVKIGRTFILKQEYITFYFPDPIMVNIPGRKKAQKAKKITIYLQINKIQQLLLETTFSLKDQLILRNYI